MIVSVVVSVIVRLRIMIMAKVMVRLSVRVMVMVKASNPPEVRLSVRVSDLKAEYELSMIAPWNRPFASGEVSSAPTEYPPALSP